MYAFLAMLWQGVLEVLVGLLDRPDIVVEEVVPQLETADPVSDSDLLGRYGMLDKD